MHLRSCGPRSRLPRHVLRRARDSPGGSISPKSLVTKSTWSAALAPNAGRRRADPVQKEKPSARSRRPTRSPPASAAREPPRAENVAACARTRRARSRCRVAFAAVKTFRSLQLPVDWVASVGPASPRGLREETARAGRSAAITPRPTDARSTGARAPGGACWTVLARIGARPRKPPKLRQYARHAHSKPRDTGTRARAPPLSFAWQNVELVEQDRPGRLARPSPRTGRRLAHGQTKVEEGAPLVSIELEVPGLRPQELEEELRVPRSVLGHIEAVTLTPCPAPGSASSPRG